MHASKSRLGNDITKSNLASFAHGNTRTKVRSNGYGRTPLMVLVTTSVLWCPTRGESTLVKVN
ncbi:hypothetical protein HanXRQr2_Chr01g0004891 [Helianthus annuus]|uniref:Uncharacterized protein n=1 Tax=Helianthus annuus TaxID=4232 RepID=A0A251VKV9_HELAN|nr:hypothetical protein HanXRQr2_Chr01g0004891 [Helianthus annuus]